MVQKMGNKARPDLSICPSLWVVFTQPNCWGEKSLQWKMAAKLLHSKPVHSAQCRHVVVCTDQIRRKRTWESLLKTIWDWESQPYQVSNMNHTLSKLPIKLHLRVCQVCCCAGARIILLFFFSVCRAPNCAPIRAFFCGLSCTKSCFNAFFYLRFFVRQIVLYGLNYVESPCSCYYFICALKM